MKRPDAKLEKDLNSMGVFTIDADKTPPAAQNEVTFKVELPILSDALPDLFEFTIQTVSKRGMKFTYKNWAAKFGEPAAPVIFSFDVSVAPPEGIDLMKSGRYLATAFSDLCWNAGVEAVTHDAQDLAFPIDAAAVYEDLAWHLPAHLTDHLIDSLGVVNETFLDGLMKDAVVYAKV